MSGALPLRTVPVFRPVLCDCVCLVPGCCPQSPELCCACPRWSRRRAGRDRVLGVARSQRCSCRPRAWLGVSPPARQAAGSPVFLCTEPVSCGMVLLLALAAAAAPALHGMPPTVPRNQITKTAAGRPSAALPPAACAFSCSRAFHSLLYFIVCFCSPRPYQEVQSSCAPRPGGRAFSAGVLATAVFAWQESCLPWVLEVLKHCTLSGELA